MSSGDDSDFADEIGLRRRYFWLYDHNEAFKIEFSDSGTTWKLGQILTESIHHGMDIDGLEASEAMGICIATQTEGPAVGKKAIMKIRMQIPPWLDDPGERDKGRDYSEFKSTTISLWANNEIARPQKLSRLGCSSTPKLLDHAIFTQEKEEYVPGGYIVYILMEKLPGRNLTHFHMLPLAKRDEVRIAFAKAYRELLSYGYEHCDPGRRNIIWDKKSKCCFIIDLEDMKLIEPRGFIPGLDWPSWCLHFRVTEADDREPMVPEDWNECPDDEGLYALAAQARAKAPHCYK